MITKWNVFNFKSIVRRPNYFAPLTIFAGPNSSGKSTFLQSMLLVTQTLANKIGSRSVVLNGALAKLGQFDDLKSADSDASQIVIGWTCKPITDPGWAACVWQVPALALSTTGNRDVRCLPFRVRSDSMQTIRARNGR